MTQGAGQGPVVRTATLRDFRVPAYVTETGPYDAENGPYDAENGPYQAENGPYNAEAGPYHAGQDAYGQPGPARVPDAVAPGAAVLPAPARPVAVHAQPAAPAVRAVVPAASAVNPDGPAAHPGGTPAQIPVPAASAADGLPDPDGYTPTERNLPVINRGDTLQVPVVTEPAPVAAPAGQEGEGRGPLYVVGDVHGYLDQLYFALAEKGLIDAEGNWSAGTSRLWFLGDFTDRGPDGIGVIDLVMRLSAQAAAAGGYCKALMGNHELLLLGAKRFGDTPVNSGAGTATFQAAWLLNGGQKSDMERLQDHHLQWMSRLDAMELEDDHLLLHSDTTAYLDYGDSIEAVNDAVREALTRNDADEYWDLFRKFTKRFAFRDDEGPGAVRRLLATYGGSRLVHGHSPIPYLLGEVGSENGEDGEGPVVDGPHVYADGLAIAMDGGVTMAGKLLVCQLPLSG